MSIELFPLGTQTEKFTIAITTNQLLHKTQTGQG